MSKGHSILSFILIHLVSFIPSLSSIIGSWAFVLALVLWVLDLGFFDLGLWALGFVYEVFMVDALIRSHAAFASTRRTITPLPSEPESETQRTGLEPGTLENIWNVFVLIAGVVTPPPPPAQSTSSLSRNLTGIEEKKAETSPVFGNQLSCSA